MSKGESEEISASNEAIPFRNTVDFDDEILFLDVETMCSPNSINMPTNRAHQFNESFGLFEHTQCLCGVRVCSESVYTIFNHVKNSFKLFRNVSNSNICLERQLAETTECNQC